MVNIRKEWNFLACCVFMGRELIDDHIPSVFRRLHKQACETMARRALHYVLKLTERDKTLSFYRDVLGMKVLRHEEFDKGCEATCNGPYAGKWSKTMIGYGPEDDHFVLELTYNYGISSYDLGNGLQKITIRCSEAKERIVSQEIRFVAVPDGSIDVDLPSSPGYKYEIRDGWTEGHADPLHKVTLASLDLQKTFRLEHSHRIIFCPKVLDVTGAVQVRSAPQTFLWGRESRRVFLVPEEFWHGILGMNVVEHKGDHILLEYADTPHFQLEFVRISEPLSHGASQGRIAFSCPENELSGIQSSAENAGYQVKTPLIRLDTPGKAAVTVVILLDPDMHEICFVGDEAFRELSQVDLQASDALAQAIKEDKSME